MQYLRAEAVIDLSAAAATVAFTIEAPAAGKLHVNQMYARIEEAIDNPTVAGVGSVEVAGTEYATFQAVDNDIVGDTYMATPDSAVGDDGVVFVTAGQDITCVTKTQGTGGTGAGTLRVYLPFSWEDTN